MTGQRSDAADGASLGDGALDRAIAAFAHALRLSCRAVQDPSASDTLANEAVAAHVAARAWAERAVEEAGRRTGG